MLQTKFITNHNKLPFSLNYSTKHPHLVAWLLGCFTSILEIIGTSIKKGKMMIKRLKTYQPKWYVELCKKVRSPCCRHPDNDKVIDYALRKAREARNDV